MECVICVCAGAVGEIRGVEWIRGLGFTNPVETGEVLGVCLCLGCCGGSGVGGWGIWSVSGRVGDVMSV